MLDRNEANAWQTEVVDPLGFRGSLSTRADRLPWPSAVTAIALLSVTLWVGIFSAISSLVR